MFMNNNNKLRLNMLEAILSNFIGSDSIKSVVSKDLSDEVLSQLRICFTVMMNEMSDQYGVIKDMGSSDVSYFKDNISVVVGNLFGKYVGGLDGDFVGLMDLVNEKLDALFDGGLVNVLVDSFMEDIVK